MELSQISGLTANMSAPVLAAGTTTTISTTGAINFAINGKAYTHAAMTNHATPTTDGTTGAAFVPVTAGYGAIFIHALAANGDLSVHQGPLAPLDASGNFITAPQLPALPATVCPFGYLVYKAAAGGASFTYGTSNQAGVSGGTYARGDLATLPSRLVIS